ncbi:hypothetical protein F4777DRAFT_318016 [Nemania sp. FL0916]|nr:hypothetical protein F4777DRAFT_318016 [Nemania sp. FL0916]
MATVTRQPFAPLNQARLQRLTSLKNRQNAISTSSPVKRKASDVSQSDNWENVDPLFSAKRAKGDDGSSKDSFIKPSNFILTKSASHNELPFPSSLKAVAPRSRTILKPQTPVAKLDTGIARSLPVSAPAGRSPTRKRSGLSSRRRTGTSVGRIDPPIFGRSNSLAMPFSIDTALRNTIPDYNGLYEPEMKSSWSFDIYEDTEQEEATNMLEHGACILDISSDEESECRRQRELDECKENVPPPDDVSQTRPRASRFDANADVMLFEKERAPLQEMDAREYYPTGYSEDSVFIVPGDEDEENDVQGFGHALQGDLAEPEQAAVVADLHDEPSFAAEEKLASVEELMEKTNDSASSITVLEPVEGTDESFEVWESSSAKDETEAVSEC